MQRDLSKRRKYGPRLWDRILLHLSKGEPLDGLWIGSYNDNPEPALHRVREALRLIKSHDPLRYVHLTRDLKRVWVFSIPTPACFNYRLDACQLDERFVLAGTTTPELLASVIVHEATHARLWSCGVGYDEAMRQKVEAICVRRQLAFARKLPNGQQAHEQAEQALAWANPTNLSNAAFWKREEDWYVEELHRLGVPEWVIRIMYVLRPAIWAVRRFVRRAGHVFAIQSRR